MATGQDIRSMVADVLSQGVELSDTEKLLLATDGTVTHSLEALRMSPVDVDILNRRVEGGTLHRTVVLRDRSNAEPLVWARSKVNLYPLSVDMEDELVSGEMGIGDLLREEYAETHREIQHMRYVKKADDGFPPTRAEYEGLLERTYSVYSDGDRVMTITEYFPKGRL